jgi:hypothetical protein
VEEYNMTKVKLTISLDSEIAEKLRQRALKKYHNTRSTSRLIEDLATGAAEAEQPETCSILGARSNHSISSEADFDKLAADIGDELDKVYYAFHKNVIPNGKPGKDYSRYITHTEWYFAFKEACELLINRYAEPINKCTGCNNLSGAVPTYPTAGKNFEIFAMLDNELR